MDESDIRKKQDELKAEFERVVSAQKDFLAKVNEAQVRLEQLRGAYQALEDLLPKPPVEVSSG